MNKDRISVGMYVQVVNVVEPWLQPYLQRIGVVKGTEGNRIVVQLHPAYIGDSDCPALRVSRDAVVLAGR